MRPILIAIVGCHARAAERRAQRATWIPHIKGADVRSFVGDANGSASAAVDDAISLPVDDGYAGLPAKVQLVDRWALEQGYEAVLKVDDDVLVLPDWFRPPPPDALYAGWFPVSEPGWCCGFAYWLRRDALEILAEAPIPDGEHAEDRWTGTVLQAHGIMPVADPGIDWIRRGRGRDPFEVPKLLQASKRLYVAAEFTPPEMVAMYRAAYGGTRYEAMMLI